VVRKATGKIDLNDAFGPGFQLFAGRDRNAGFVLGLQPEKVRQRQPEPAAQSSPQRGTTGCGTKTGTAAKVGMSRHGGIS
jgi:hypothetical protein